MSKSGVMLHRLRKFSLALLATVMLAPVAAFSDDNGSGSCSLDDSMQELPDQAKGAASPLSSEQGGSDVISAIGDWKKDHDSCKSDNKDAQKECFEACSKDAQNGLTGANGLGGQMNVLSGNVNQTANQQNQASQQMQNGYSGYLAKCTATQQSCTKSCGKALEGAKKVKSKADSVQCTKEETKAQCNQAKSKVKEIAGKESGSGKDVAQGKNEQCSKDFTQKQSDASKLLDALKSIMQALAQAAQAQSDSGDSSTSSTSSTTLTCTELQAAGNTAAMSSRTDCICGDGTFAGLDPRRAGCPMAGQAADGSSSASGFGPSQVEAAAASSPSSNVDGAATPAGMAQASGGGLGGGAGGGGGGMMGGGGASPSGTKANVEAGQKAGLKADILAGDSGGGGGGGGWSFGGTEKPESTKAVGARGLAAISAARAAAGVSGSAGRSNWEKIRDRYKDNRPTFVKDQ